MDIIKKIKTSVKNSKIRLVFPEGEDERILKAVKIALKEKLIIPILVGDDNKIRNKAKKLNMNLKGVKIIDPLKSEDFGRYADIYSKKSKIARRTAELIVRKPLIFSALVLDSGGADGMIAGAVYTSGDVIAVSNEVVGLKKGISVPSSFFVMSIPNYSGGEKGNLIYADVSVNPNPTSEELADIAIASGDSAKEIFGWVPRIAMLSFSTRGSAEHPDVSKVIKAKEIAVKKARGMHIDGEFQADSALVMPIAKRKMKKVGEVAGRANILIFPDLDAGNISYKLTQIFTGAKAYGPILQGFAKPISDLSRGATVEDIVGTISILAAWAKRRKK